LGTSYRSNFKHCFSLDANDQQPETITACDPATVWQLHVPVLLSGDVYMLDDLFFAFLCMILLITIVGT